ncbi:MAG: hypothetical protein ACRDKW_02785 [Actinomycetota bacterium]
MDIGGGSLGALDGGSRSGLRVGGGDNRCLGFAGGNNGHVAGSRGFDAPLDGHRLSGGSRGFDPSLVGDGLGIQTGTRDLNLLGPTLSRSRSDQLVRRRLNDRFRGRRSGRFGGHLGRRGLLRTRRG